MPLVQTLSHLKFFLFFFFFERFCNLDFFFLGKLFSFFGKDLEILKFFLKIFFLYLFKIYIYIYMNKVHQMLHGFLEFKET